MIIYVDIDNTICTTSGTDYVNATPCYDKIDIINKLFDKKHEIVYWTARGSGSGIDYYELTNKQLQEWGVKYDKLLLGKPPYDLFIDDKTINKIDKNLIVWDQNNE